MPDEVQRLRSALAQLAGETRRRQSNIHPTPEVLVAYSAGELEAAAADSVLEHLAVCRSCTRLILGLPAFLATPGQEAQEMAFDAETDDSWQRLQVRLGMGSAAAPGPDSRPEEGAETRSPDTSSRQAIFALAACLAACLIGFPVWMATHGRSRVPPPIVSLNPPERMLGDTPPPATPPPALRLNAEAAALVLYLPPPQVYARFRVEILDRDGKTRSPAAAAPISPQAILVVLTHRQLPPGDYRLRVFGVESRRQQPLADYPLRILAR